MSWRCYIQAHTHTHTPSSTLIIRIFYCSGAACVPNQSTETKVFVLINFLFMADNQTAANVVIIHFWTNNKIAKSIGPCATVAAMRAR